MGINEFVRQIRETDVSDLDFNTIGVWPLPFRVAVLVLIFVVVVGLGFYFHVKDLNTELSSLENKEQALRETFEERAFEAANFNAYKEQMVEIEKSFGALLSQLPSDTEVPGMLEDITEIGYGAGLDIRSINLQPEVAAEFYVELPIRIVTVGGYHDFGTFVSGIAGLPRIVTLHDFSITTDEESRAQRLEVVAKTYRYKGEGE